MLAGIVGSEITGIVRINNPEHVERYLLANPEYREVPDQEFEHSIDCYEYIDGEIKLNDNWEALRAENEPAPPVKVPVMISPVEFKMLLPSAARIAIGASTDPVIMDFRQLINDPRLTQVDMRLPTVKEGLDYIAEQGILTPEQVAQILENQPVTQPSG